MAVPVAALAKIAAAALSDEDTRKRLGWIVAAICSPLILTLALICSLLSGSAEHNNSAVLLCFNGGNIPGKTPTEYVAYIEDMRRSFTLLDDAIAAVNDMTENSNSLDGIRVKAVFYAIFFGEDTPSRRAHRQFVDCFVTYEERTRTVTDEDGTETEESYTVAIPIADIAAVYDNLENTLHLEISAEQKSNADSVYSLVRYGIAGGSEDWIPGADVPFIGADGFCSPIGSGWERRVTSEFGNRVDPITGKRKGHGGMDLAVPTGTPIRAALPGTVTVSKYNAGGYGGAETVKQMLESCPNNCFMLLMPQGDLKLAADEAEKALCGEEYTVLLDYSGDSEPIKTADLLEMVVIDMRKDEQGCWYVLVVHPKLLEALRREKKMT